MIGLSTRVLVDTNLLIYPYDPREPVKQRQAIEVLEKLAAAEIGAVSTQVLSEFFHVSTRKIPEPLTPSEALHALERILRVWRVLAVTPEVVFTAARGVIEHRLNFWDAQLWAVAYLNQIPVIFSEDFQDQGSLGGVRTVNPFHAKFRFDSWIQ